MPTPAPSPSVEAVSGPASVGVAPSPGPTLELTVSALLSPPESNIRVGELATVSVVVVGVKDLLAVELVLAFDAALLEPVDAGSGSLLTLDGSSVGTETQLEPGKVRVRFTRATGATGSGAIAVAKFKGVKPGPGTVGVESIRLQTAGGTLQPIPPGQARVTVRP
jgi:hypothetical protein